MTRRLQFRQLLDVALVRDVQKKAAEAGAMVSAKSLRDAEQNEEASRTSCDDAVQEWLSEVDKPSLDLAVLGFRKHTLQQRESDLARSRQEKSDAQDRKQSAGLAWANAVHRHENVLKLVGSEQRTARRRREEADLAEAVDRHLQREERQ